MARNRGTGVAAKPTGRSTPATGRGHVPTIGGKPVSPAVARARKGAATAQGHGSSGK